jgi:hypothetical protein
LFAVVLFAVACADQGEGDRCDPANGNADCESGLVCVKAERLALVDVGAICCPPPGDNNNTVKECRDVGEADGGSVLMPTTDSGTAAADSATPPPADGSSSDAASLRPTDASTDASIDASLDASQ